MHFSFVMASSPYRSPVRVRPGPSVARLSSGEQPIKAKLLAVMSVYGRGLLLEVLLVALVAVLEVLRILVLGILVVLVVGMLLLEVLLVELALVVKLVLLDVDVLLGDDVEDEESEGDGVEDVVVEVEDVEDEESKDVVVEVEDVEEEGI